MPTKKIKTRRTDRRTGGSIYDTVTKTLIELLEGGTIPWRTRWSSVRPKQQKEKGVTTAFHLPSDGACTGFSML